MRARRMVNGLAFLHLRGLCLFMVLGSFGAGAIAQPVEETPTPSPTEIATPTAAVTPTSVPTPAVCLDVQACVDQGVSQLVNSCKAASSSCSQVPTVFAVSATELADRAVADARCGRQTVSRKRARCNACYKAAKAPLQARFGGKLFKGLLAQAVRIIETKRVVACGGSPK